MLHNRYLVPGGEDQSAAAEANLLQQQGCHVELLEEDNRRIELGAGPTAVHLSTVNGPVSVRENED